MKNSVKCSIAWVETIVLIFRILKPTWPEYHHFLIFTGNDRLLGYKNASTSESVALCDSISGVILGLMPSQWETSLQSNTVSHWLAANLESALNLILVCLCVSKSRECKNRIIIFTPVGKPRLAGIDKINISIRYTVLKLPTTPLWWYLNACMTQLRRHKS